MWGGGSEEGAWNELGGMLSPRILLRILGGLVMG